jgi:hypothetical protein
MCRGPQLFQKSRRHFKIIGTRKVQQNSFHDEDSSKLSAKVQNLVTTLVTWNTYICRATYCPIIKNTDL